MKWLLAIALLSLTPQVAAIPEADAPLVDDRIEAVWHEPETVVPNTQWQGFIELKPGHNVTDVRYQICRVGQFCFAGPTLATQVNDNMWQFDTAAYGIRGQSIQWGINDGEGEGDWRVGMQFVLFTAADNRTNPFGGELVPHGVDCDSEEGKAMGWIPCQETHYIAFDMEGKARATKDVPGLSVLALLAGLVVLAARRR